MAAWKSWPFFLNQVWAHLDHYGPMYADNMACVDAIVANLEGEAAEWVMGLHDEGAPELGDPNAFLGELRVCFGDNMQAWNAEFEIHTIRQGSRLVTEYIQELAGRLRHWPEQLLVHYF